jgi:hypothetical protein
MFFINDGILAIILLNLHAPHGVITPKQFINIELLKDGMCEKHASSGEDTPDIFWTQMDICGKWCGIQHGRSRTNLVVQLTNAGERITVSDEVRDRSPLASWCYGSIYTDTY